MRDLRYPPGCDFFNYVVVSAWLSNVMCRKPSCRAEANAARIKRSVLLRKGLDVTKLAWYADWALYGDGASYKLFDHTYRFPNYPRTPRELMFRVGDDKGNEFLVMAEGYDYPRYIGRLVD